MTSSAGQSGDIIVAYLLSTEQWRMTVNVLIGQRGESSVLFEECATKLKKIIF